MLLKNIQQTNEINQTVIILYWDSSDAGYLKCAHILELKLQKENVKKVWSFLKKGTLGSARAFLKNPTFPRDFESLA